VSGERLGVGVVAALNPVEAGTEVGHTVPAGMLPLPMPHSTAEGFGVVDANTVGVYIGSTVISKPSQRDQSRLV
jgi:hypothetical protein